MDPIYIGQIMLWSGYWLPTGWLVCDGASYQQRQYTALFAIIGNTYGTGATGTFKVPDLRGMVPVGAGQGKINSTPLTNYTLGKAAGVGQNTIALGIGQIPLHTHGSTLDISTAYTANLAVSTAAAQVATPTAGLVPAAGASPGTSGGDTVDVNLYNSGGSPVALSNAISGNVSITAKSVTLANTGTGAAHENMMPFLSMYYIIACEGNFPELQ